MFMDIRFSAGVHGGTLRCTLSFVGMHQIHKLEKIGCEPTKTLVLCDLRRRGGEVQFWIRTPQMAKR